MEWKREGWMGYIECIRREREKRRRKIRENALHVACTKRERKERRGKDG